MTAEPTDDLNVCPCHGVTGCSCLRACLDTDAPDPNPEPILRPVPDPTSNAGDDRPRAISLNNLKTKPRRWIAPGYLPLAALAVLVGDEGIGKSLWWALVAAHLTTGRPFGAINYAGGQPLDVLIVITEDTPDEVKARLEYAGADLTRVHIIAEPDGDPAGIIMATGTSGYDLVNSEITRLTEDGHLIGLVVADAWLDTVPGNLRVKDPQDARRALAPWKNLAARHTLCVLLMTHTNRVDTGRSRDRWGISGAIRQVVRLGLFAAKSPQGTLHIGPEKSNARKDNAVTYALEVTQARPRTDHDDGTVARLTVTGRTGAPMDQHLAAWHAEERRANRAPNADERLDQWLAAYIDDNAELTLQGREIAAEATKRAASEAGHNVNRLRSAVKRLGGLMTPLGPGKPWVYRFPGPDFTDFTPPKSESGVQTSHPPACSTEHVNSVKSVNSAVESPETPTGIPWSVNQTSQTSQSSHPKSNGDDL